MLARCPVEEAGGGHCAGACHMCARQQSRDEIPGGMALNCFLNFVPLNPKP